MDDTNKGSQPPGAGNNAPKPKKLKIRITLTGVVSEIEKNKFTNDLKVSEVIITGYC